MKKLILILLVILTFSGCGGKTTSEEKTISEEESIAEEKTNCAVFKTGTFTYSDESYDGVKIIRTDSTQTEVYKKEGFAMHSTIKWVGDCKYVLTIIDVLNIDGKDLIGKRVEAEIIEVKADRYTLIAKSNGENSKMEMIKVE